MNSILGTPVVVGGKFFNGEFLLEKCSAEHILISHELVVSFEGILHPQLELGGINVEGDHSSVIEGFFEVGVDCAGNLAGECEGGFRVEKGI